MCAWFRWPCRTTERRCDPPIATRPTISGFGPHGCCDAGARTASFPGEPTADRRIGSRVHQRPHSTHRAAFAVGAAAPAQVHGRCRRQLAGPQERATGRQVRLPRPAAGGRVGQMTRAWRSRTRSSPCASKPPSAMTLRPPMSANHIVFWNARGLNSRARRSVVRNISHHHQASIVCLQETKIENLSVTLNFDLTSSDFDYAALPASSTAGGAYTSWRRDLWDVSSVIVRRFSITVQLSSVASSLGPWTLTNVYGPPNRPEKHAFLQELRDISSTCAGPWLVCGDFNLIYRAADKNNIMAGCTGGSCALSGKQSTISTWRSST